MNQAWVDAGTDSGLAVPAQAFLQKSGQLAVSERDVRVA